MQNPVLLERVSLSLIAHKHAPALLAILTQPQVAQYNDYALPLSREEVKQMIQNDISSYYNQTGLRLAILNNLDDCLMGSVGFYDIGDEQAWLGFELSHQHWNQGYMYEVLINLINKQGYMNWLETPITTIFARVAAANCKSIQLLTKIGFKQIDDETWGFVQQPMEQF